ncbi:hypothetical protein KLP28_04945 [Nocardioidaceae bacterium]|nr:hypothetical protein KLP28_04945 [Nocardioidaceae bacterium]
MSENERASRPRVPAAAARLTPGSAPRAEPDGGLQNIAWITGATGVLVLAATLAIVEADAALVWLVIGFALLLVTICLLVGVAINEQRAILREQRGLLRQLASRLPGDG